jgi:hypothetical protein
MKERWIPVHRFEGSHEVSNLGRVRSLDHRDRLGRLFKGRMLSARLNMGGYEAVRLRTISHKTATYPVHRLVLESFIGPRPPGYHCCHFDGDKTHNNLANLRWDTAKANRRDSSRHGRIAAGEQNGSSKLTEPQVRHIWLSEETAAAISEEMGVNRETIGRVRRGHGWVAFTMTLPPQPQRDRSQWRRQVKEVCPRGHPYRGENLLFAKHGKYTARYCRICVNTRAREKYAAQRDTVTYLDAQATSDAT